MKTAKEHSMVKHSNIFFSFLALLKIFIQMAATFSELRSYVKLVLSLWGIDISLGSEIVCMEIHRIWSKVYRAQVSGFGPHSPTKIIG